MILRLKKTKKLVPSAHHRPLEYLLFSMMYQGGAECPRIGISKREDVLLPVEKIAFHQRAHMPANFCWQALEVEVLRRLIQR